MTDAQASLIIEKLDKILAHIGAVPMPVQAEPAKAQAVPTAKTGFDLFWSVYPRKIGKGAAELSWKKIRPDDTLQSRIIDAV